MTDAAVDGWVSPLAPFLDGRVRRSRFSVDVPSSGELARVEALLAGAAEVDITPPPGLPKAGYSSNAHIGNGFRTRLRARILHLRAGTTSLALVQCDLLGGSSVLQHLVARAIAASTDIPLAGLWIGATHTHAGPGQFLGTDFYNRWASNKPGFDPAWTDQLVGRIADGVVEAHDTRRPARLAVGSTDVWGLTRNRSHDPYVHNETVSDARTDPSDPQRKWVAVNSALHLIRVDTLDGSGSRSGDATTPLAAAVVFSVHGTGISMKAREYNADLWAYLTGELAHRLERRHGHRPVVGAMEGTHADVAPALRPGLAGHREAERIGRGIGAAAADLHERLGAELSGDVRLGAGLREVDLNVPAQRTIDDITLPNRPAVGAALIAGAMENVTPVIWRIPPFRAGTPRHWGARGEHGPKWIIGGRRGQALVQPIRTFPRVLAVQSFRVGDTLLVGLPFEITVESGRRIEAAVVDAVADPPTPDQAIERVVVSSVANEYWGYVTTPEEYERQFYEGGHTIYGPNTLPFLAAQAGRLGGEVAAASGMVTHVLPSREFSLATHRYLPAPDRVPVERRFLTAPTFTDPTWIDDGYWETTWLDVGPGTLDWTAPLVRMDAADGSDGAWRPALHEDGRRADDQGWSIEVTHLGATDELGGHRYRVRWFDPVLRAGRRHRFTLLTNGPQPELSGPAFD